MSEGAQVHLKYPVTVNGAAVHSLFLRRPKVRDVRDAQKQLSSNDDPAGVEVRLIANLCEHTPETIEELDLFDWNALREAYQSFLPDTPDTMNSFE